MILIKQYLLATRKAASERGLGLIAKTAVFATFVDMECQIAICKSLSRLLVHTQRGEVITYLIVSTDRPKQNRWRIPSV
jgi:hypothetical protein